MKWTRELAIHWQHWAARTIQAYYRYHLRSLGSESSVYTLRADPLEWLGAMGPPSLSKEYVESVGINPENIEVAEPVTGAQSAYIHNVCIARFKDSKRFRQQDETKPLPVVRVAPQKSERYM